jgi:hypothetical protein
MLIEEYDEKIGKYTCVSESFNWIAFTGFGDTPEEARKEMYLKHSKMLKPNPTAIICTGT